MRNILALFIILLLSVSMIQLLRNTDTHQNGDEEMITDPYLLEGKRLSEIHCANCHKYPEPGLLPWEIWSEGPYFLLLENQSGKQKE